MSVEPGIVHPERFERPGRTAEEERNMRLAREVMEAFSRTDFDFFYSKTIKNAEVLVVGLTDEKLGEHAKNPNLVPQTFNQGMRFTVKCAIAEGNTCCIQWDDVAMATSGKQYENSGMSVFKFTEDGQIASYVEYIDPDKFLEVI